MKVRMTSIIAFSLSALAVLSLSGCGGSDDGNGNGGMTKAAREHAAFRASLKDSVTLYRQRVDVLRPQLDSLRDRFAALNSLLEIDDREESIEIYRMAKGWKNYDTMAGTGIIARILENGEVELVASSTHGTFISVALSSGGESVSTYSVSASSDLNYTVGDVSRVTYFGSDAVAMCEFAASHKGAAVELIFKGQKDTSVPLSDRQVAMLAVVGDVVAAKKRLDTAERNYTIAYNKLSLYENEVRKDSIANSSRNRTETK